MVERRSALAECLKPGLHGAAGATGPGIEIREVKPLTAVQVAAFDADGAASAVDRALGTPAPSGRNGVATAGEAPALLAVFVPAADSGWDCLQPSL